MKKEYENDISIYAPYFFWQQKLFTLFYHYETAVYIKRRWSIKSMVSSNEVGRYSRIIQEKSLPVKLLSGLKTFSFTFQFNLKRLFNCSYVTVNELTGASSLMVYISRENKFRNTFVNSFNQCKCKKIKE